MALDFPASPTLNQIYTGPNGVAWQWDGAKWLPGNTPTAYASTQYVDAAVGTALHDVGRNLLHNSMFNVQQRGAGPWTSNQYTADRWVVAFSGGTCQININPASDLGRSQIGDEEVRFYLGAVFTGTAGAGDYTRMIQSVEGVRRLAGKTVTVSFWALAAVAGVKLGVSMDQIFGNGGSPSASVTLNGQSFTLAATWARYSATFTFPSVAGMTFGTAGDDRMQLDFWYSSGATNNVRAGNIGVQSGTVQIWGVQLELGTVATPLEKLDPVTQLQQCQRFYQTVTCSVRGNGATAISLFMQMSWPTMRATPASALLQAGSRVNVQGISMNAYYPSSGVFGCATAAAGDGYIMNDIYSLSADL